jgi:N-acetylmuramoyl-L-alanine amidase
MRGLWISRFDWIHSDPDSMKYRIIDIMKKTAEMHYNTVFFQVRGQAETLYPSPFEPWSKLIQGKDPGYDPVKLAVQEARKHGLTFYAYINLLTLWNEKTHPRNPQHLYFKHGPEVDPDSSWICFDASGKPMELNEYYYLNPALPAVKTYLKRVIKQFVENYDVDGLHFDRIRYPGPQYVFNPYSLRLFHDDSLQYQISRSDWAREKLTDLVEDVVAEALLIKPYLVVSAATWGMYRTRDLSGYEKFGSGYDNYYQDAIDWLDRGIMDIIVPMIYWDIKDPKPNYHELWNDFKNRTSLYKNIIPGIRLKSEWIANAEIINQVSYLRQNEALGHVMFSYRVLENNTNKSLHSIIYPHKADLPDRLKRNYPKQIVGLNIRKIKPYDDSDRNWNIAPFSFKKLADSEGWFGLILPRLPKLLSINDYELNTDDWKLPYRYIVELDSSVSRGTPWLEFRNYQSYTTIDSSFNLLCRTDYPAHALINHDTVKIYKTGIFFDGIPLNLGINRLSAQVITPDSNQVFYEIELNRNPKHAKPAIPLWIDTSTISFDSDHILLNKDEIPISFNGSMGQRAFLELKPGKQRILMQRKDFVEYSHYMTNLKLANLKKEKKYQLKLILEPISVEFSKKKLKFTLKNTVLVKDAADFPLVMTEQENALFKYNLGKIRLGGPLIAEYPPGIHLQVNGSIGDHYRIYLSELEEGFIQKNAVKTLPSEYVKPDYYIRNVHVRPAENSDILTIPYPSPVPYAIYPEPGNQLIKLNLYGVKTSSTWMVHRSNLQYIKKVTWRQLTRNTYQLLIYLNTSKIWGYDCKPVGNQLVFRIKHPPIIDPDSLFNNIKLAIEAGHGGDNTGAIGLSGLKEKTINLDLAKKLEKIALDSGMQVLQVRDKDSYLSLSEKRSTINQSDADILVSIHANASGSRAGFLGVNGTSTYYNNPFWAEFAQFVYERLLDLELEEFGVVGSFNYRIIRMSSRPAILVEQAFMTQAVDEELLASENFRDQLAAKIFQGITDFIKYMDSDERDS